MWVYNTTEIRPFGSIPNEPTLNLNHFEKDGAEGGI